MVACGPESSGTRLLARILSDYIGVDTVHHSMPNGGEWWDFRKFGPRARFVVIQRRPDATTASAMARNMAATADDHARDWARAVSMLAAIPGAYWLSYEALIAQPRVQADNLARWLRRMPRGHLEAITDENAKWLAGAYSSPAAVSDTGRTGVTAKD